MEIDRLGNLQSLKSPQVLRDAFICLVYLAEAIQARNQLEHYRHI